jgi:hypothetical protein
MYIRKDIMRTHGGHTKDNHRMEMELSLDNVDNVDNLHVRL